MPARLSGTGTKGNSTLRNYHSDIQGVKRRGSRASAWPTRHGTFLWLLSSSFLSSHFLFLLKRRSRTTPTINISSAFTIRAGSSESILGPTSVDERGRCGKRYRRKYREGMGNRNGQQECRGGAARRRLLL